MLQSYSVGALIAPKWPELTNWPPDTHSTGHMLVALEEFDHLGVRFVSVQDQIDTDSPMSLVMFAIIGAIVELESSLISERVTACMRAAKAWG